MSFGDNAAAFRRTSINIFEGEVRPGNDRNGLSPLVSFVRETGSQLARIYPDATGPLKVPRLTTAQRDALTGLLGGELIWNTDTGELQAFGGTDWGAVWSPAVNQSVGLTSFYPAGTAVAPNGGTADFVLPIPATFIEANLLSFQVYNIAPGPGISSFDVALYTTEAARDAGTFSLADAGLQFLGPAIQDAATGGAVTRWGVLGLLQGSLDGATPTLWGKVRNNDVASTFDAFVAIEAYGRLGSRAV